MTSVDRKSGAEGKSFNPWEDARFFKSGNPNKPDEALYRVKVEGIKEKAGRLGELTFYGYFQTKTRQITNLHFPILVQPDLRRLEALWKKEGNLYESIGSHNEGALAYLNALNDIPLIDGINELQGLRQSTDVHIHSEQHRDPKAVLFRHPSSIIISRPHLDLRFLPTTTPYAVERLVYGISRDIPFLFKPLSKDEFYQDVKRVFSKR